MLLEETSIQIFSKEGFQQGGGVMTVRNCKQNCKLCSAAGGSCCRETQSRAAEPGRAKNRVARLVPGTLGQTGVPGLYLYTVEKTPYTNHMFPRICIEHTRVIRNAR